MSIRGTEEPIKEGDLANTSAGRGASLVGVHDVNGRFTANPKNTETCLDEAKQVADAANTLGLAAIGAQLRKLRIQFGDIADAVNGEAKVVNVGAALPANAVVLAHDLQLDTDFAGGGVVSVAADLGIAGDATAIVNHFDALGSAAAGKRYSGAAGDHTKGGFDAKQLIATFTPDGAHNLTQLTGGDLTIRVWFFVLAG